MLEVIRCVLLCMLKAVEGGLCLLGGAGGAGGNALCTALYAGGCRGWALFVEVSEVLEGRRCVGAGG